MKRVYWFTTILAILSLTGCGLFSPQPSSQIVDLNLNGKTIHLRVHDRFLLKLGEGFDWNISISDMSVISRVPNIMVIRGAQGIYEAKSAGQTTLQAVGDPLCRQAPTPCEIHSISFQVNIDVK
ncbi:hypothetical protein HY229_07135 [Candidatus Acetothermia bacterium]|nr:hypothetical protein [Candidatus Acetothermia bacterium]MBI3643854.1 hypothetical protein [Candidatus Acetothermia bacterium]